MTLTSHIDETRLVNLINGPAAWRRRWDESVACANVPGDIDAYFPDDGELPSTEALARCITCPVTMHCLATALIHESEDGLRFGWWGGCSPEERELLADRIGLGTRQVEIDLREPADLARILRGHKRTIPSIAAELGCTERTVYRYLATTAA